MDRSKIEVSYESIDVQVSDLIAVDPSVFDFRYISSERQNSSNFYFIPVRFVFKNTQLAFPKADLNFSVKIFIQFTDIFGVYQITTNEFIALNLQICPHGNVLEADSNLFYKCVPCLAGAFLNSSVDSIAVCSKCPSGRFSLYRSTFCGDCPLGRFSKDEGQEECLSCPTGSYSSDLKQTTCSFCDIGM
jgi:hypothetical protein